MAAFALTPGHQRFTLFDASDRDVCEISRFGVTKRVTVFVLGYLDDALTEGLESGGRALEWMEQSTPGAGLRRGRGFYSEGDPASPTHRKLLEHIEAHGWGKREDYTLHSFRQEGRTCMQVVIARPSVGAGPFCADFDIDLGDPLQDVDGFLIHMGELAFGGDTDHLELHDALARGAMKDFVYYSVA